MTGTSIARVTKLRKMIPAAVSGANEDANFFAASCLLAEKGHEALLVAGECRRDVVTRGVQFAREHVGLGDGESRSLAPHERNAGGRIANQRDAPLRPVIHVNLAHGVVVQLTGTIQLSGDLRPLPTGIAKDASQDAHRLLVAVEESVGKDEEE